MDGSAEVPAPVQMATQSDLDAILAHIDKGQADHTAVMAAVEDCVRIEELVENAGAALPTAVRKECQDLLEQINEQSALITEKTHAMVGLAEESGIARLLGTMPGIGPLTALTVEAFAPAMENFRSGRELRSMARPRLEGRAGRLPPAVDHRRHDARELGEPQAARVWQLAGADAGAQAPPHAGGHRAGQQDGPVYPGHADEAGKLSGSGPSRSDLR
jgi:hypothetical protein